MSAYDTRRQPDVYRDGRALTDHARAVWTAAFARHAPDPRRLLDLGCGTGRFSVPVAEALHTDVIGVDASRRMLDAADRHPRVRYLRATAEALPLSQGCVGAALLSCVLHHLGDREAAALELARVVRPGGVVLVRQAFGGRLDGAPYLAYFPTALAIAERTSPTVEDACTAFGRAGFDFVALETIEQQTSPSPPAYAERIALRANSLLEDIGDEEFERGIARMRGDATDARDGPVLEWLDLVVFRR